MNRVLIIDDELWVSEVIKNIICWTDYGFCVEDVCHDSLSAMELIREKRPQLVLTDIRMPEKTGLEIIKEISAELPDTMFVVVSGYNDFEYARTALTYGAIGYLLKPIDQVELEQIVVKARGILEDQKRYHVVETCVYKEYEQTIERLRKQFFSNCFEGRQDSGLTLREINRELKLNLKEGHYRIVSITVLDLRDGTTLFAEINKLLWKRQLPVLCNEVVSFLYRGKMILILNYQIDRSGVILKGLQSMVSDVTNKKFDVTFVAGEEFNDIGKIQKEFHRVKEMEFIRLFSSARFYLYDPTIDYGENVNTLLLPNLDICIKQVIKNGDEEEAYRLIQGAFERVMNCMGNNPVAFARGIYKIAEILQENLAEVPKSVREICIKLVKDLETAGSTEQIKEYLQKIMKEIIKAQVDIGEQKEKNTVAQVIDYLNGNYMNNITLTDMAEIVHLNANYFSEIFHKEKGITFKEYLTQIRMERAKELLKRSNYRQSEIAAMVGYNDTKHFSKIFRKYVGITTTEYRKLMVNK